MIEMDHGARDSVGLSYVLGLLSPITPYGVERVRAPRFYAPLERAALEDEWANVQTAVCGLGQHAERYGRLCRLMMHVRDIRRTLRRCREDVLSEVELFEVKRFLLQLARIVPLFREVGAGYRGIALTEEVGALTLLDPDGTRAGGFVIGGSQDGALLAVREEKRRVEQALSAASGAEREALLDARRQLIVREEEEALAVRARLSVALRPYVGALLTNAEMLGLFDFTVQRAKLARARGAVMPRVADAVRFTGMEHPQVADALSAKGQAFTRVSMEAAPGATVVTGANMGGKSVALRALALNVLLCHAGFFAFAEIAELPLFDAVEVIFGDLSAVQAGLSSFGGEVLRIHSILQRIEGGAFCFVALDEPARGTNPREGGALVCALVRKLQRARAVSVVATHYDGVAAQAGAHYQAAGLRAPPETPSDGDRLSFIARHMNYGLVRVDTAAEAPREALTVCRLLGLDSDVVEDMARALGVGEGLPCEADARDAEE